MAEENDEPTAENAEQQADEPAAEAAEPTAEATDAPEPTADAGDADAEPTPEEPAAESAEPGEESGAGDAAPQEPAAAEKAPGAEKKSDLPPGAELEPIAIEPERELTAEERAAAEAEAEERAAAEADEDEDEPAPTRRAPITLDPSTRVQATGKRKSAVARVVVRAGSGKVEVNGRDLDEYFPRPDDRTRARQALVTSGYESAVDVAIRAHGGGISGQAGAVRHGIARALVEIDPELRGDLKRRGMLTRDARAKERRKAGLKKARKRPQFSKR